MKKVALALVLLGGIGFGAYLLLSRHFIRSQVENRIEDLLQRRAHVSEGKPIKRKSLHTFFDQDGYDASAPSPQAWIEKWQAENDLDGFSRTLVGLEVKEGSMKKVSAEFATKEGYEAQPELGIEEDLRTCRYRVRLVWDEQKTEWMIRHLSALDEEDNP